MKIRSLFTSLLLAGFLTACVSTTETASEQSTVDIRIATFNVSMEATNYQANGEEISLQALLDALASGNHSQIKNIAEIVQRVRPDILLLNEFDYVPEQTKGIQQFIDGYLKVSQQGQKPIDYPYVYLAPVNTGVKTPFQEKGSRLTHYGFGRYPGQYGMVLLSKFPIDAKATRTFQNFLWKDMPNHMMPVEKDGSSWYSAEQAKDMRLSSKSHWDVPVDICGETLHVLASHPTPPVFDGEEDRNGRRNHDEIRFWQDYLNADKTSYHYDDKGEKGGIKADQPFVIMGDLNASSQEGSAIKSAMANLFAHPRVNDYPAPISAGGKENKPDNQFAASHTAGWGMRADYVIPSVDMEVTDSGVFWPAKDEATARLVKGRRASSDHRLVWVDVSVSAKACH